MESGMDDPGEREREKGNIVLVMDMLFTQWEV